MATSYAVLQIEHVGTNDESYIYAATVDAANAEKACRIVAEDTPDDILAEGVTLIAVPARNWTTGRNTFKAETRRRLLKS